ncbi:L,D-transpeptidase family protein [Altererythrobacter xixiisoli]|uniref:L,D-transpeptidase family protein n=1 Tax=Croceibacterium xixiisoli TaxID=1476466 RepID=A0A6I4TXS2_9SPHN|nr:L,D-transpeptidase [Croceibacterium xixiisoli]MXO99567.1 L,D-transpeptidase family protein [Croceibacterium xixiisoli]
MIGRVVLGSLLLLSCAGEALAQGANVSSAVELARQAERLQPGQWVWAPAIAPQGPVTVYVDLSAQTATVYRNGVRIGVSTVSTGKPGHETPTGVFTILQKDAKHRSSTYNNASMPYQERLTWDGVALHAGGLPGYPESHGCIHLPLEFSRLLFGITDLGGTVIVAGQAGRPTAGAGAGVLDPQQSGPEHVPLAPGEPFRWEPHKAPEGPLTIIISRSDQRLITLRNGAEIGRARIALPDRDFETHVLTYASGATDSDPHWIYAGVPGHLGEQGKPADIGMLNAARMPPAFREHLLRAITPGATVLITQSPINPQTTGGVLTVLASHTPE